MNISYTKMPQHLINEETIDAIVTKERAHLHSHSLLETPALTSQPAYAVSFLFDTRNNKLSSASRSVQFSDENREYMAPAPLMVEDFSSMWYSARELFGFRTEVRQAVQEYQTKERSELPRGMETYVSNARSQHRWMTVQCVRSAVRKGMNADMIATVSRRCSAWDSEIAVLQAIHDRAAVYFLPGRILRHLPSVASIKPTFPFAMRK